MVIQTFVATGALGAPHPSAAFVEPHWGAALPGISLRRSGSQLAELYIQIAPGAIFCLKQSGDTQGSETVNPLQPYFLVYVRDDGVVRYSFAQPKQILEIFRLLCVQKSKPYEDLCTLFDRETHNGADMARYTALLDKAVEAIVHTFKKRAIAGLLSGRSGRLVGQSKQARSQEQFELISWLVIKPAE